MRSPSGLDRGDTAALRQLDGDRKPGHTKAMLKWALRALAVPVLAICLLAAWGGARTLLSAVPPLRGEMVDIGGRRIRVVCEGVASERPLVIMESGIYGSASDWAAVQSGLTKLGFRSCAYDRAGLGWSDPGPLPRDTQAAVGDLEAWLKAKGETGKLILVGHSMAGFNARLFTYRNPGRIAGLVLVDAANPERTTGRSASLVRRFTSLAGLAQTVGRFGLLKPFDGAGDQIGLDGPAHAEKIYLFGKTSHNVFAAEEAKSILASAEAVRRAGKLDPAIPVAAVTEGPKDNGDWARGRISAALSSHHGVVENVPGANHASLLGRDHAGAIVRAVQFVASVRKPS
jgi:pimeloyl-ACP methyl ester carboxylesterase